MSHSTQNRPIWRHFSKPISWLGMVKLNLTQQKHTFTNQKKCTTTQNKHKKLKPGSVICYDIWPGNRAGLFSTAVGQFAINEYDMLFSKEKISKAGDK